MELIFSTHEFGDPDAFTQFMIEALDQSDKHSLGSIRILVEQLVKLQNPNQFIISLCKPECGVFKQPILAVHLLNLYIRAQLCPLNKNLEHFEIYEKANFSQFHMIYYDWLIEIDNLKIIEKDKNK
jgi:hypothetical protein